MVDEDEDKGRDQLGLNIEVVQESAICEHVRNYISRGFNVTPVGGESKRPYLTNWQNLRLAPEDVARAFSRSEPVNVGLILGESSSWLVDVDLDCDEALVAAKELLPPTEMVSGRASKRTSHYWYRCVGAMTTKFQGVNKDGAGKMLVELRSTGGQTVVWPSIHTSGELVEWEASGDPRNIEYGELLAAVSKVAVVCQLARVWPEKGSRHDAFMALCGWLLRSGLSDESTFDVVRTLAIVTGREERDSYVKDAEKAYEDTLGKRDGETGKLTGIPTLVRKVGLERAKFDLVIGKVKDWLGIDEEMVARVNGKLTVNKNEKGNPIYSLEVLEQILKLDKLWGGKIRRNTFTGFDEFDGVPLTDAMMTGIRIEIIKRYKFQKVPKDELYDVVERVAQENKYCPVSTYLNALEWDGVWRLDTLATDVLGAVDPISNVLLKKWMVGAVARALRPGCKNDNVLVLYGKQGIRKSTFFKTLASEAWFSDSDLDLSSKDARSLLTYKVWILEWAELENITTRSAESAVKSFISATEDYFRPAYARKHTSVPRKVVFCGSTNRDEFLYDRTGSRRFWVIEVPDQVDIDRLVEVRDQVWAEAVFLFKGNFPWYLTPEEDSHREGVASQFEPSQDEKHPLLPQVQAALDKLAGEKGEKAWKESDTNLSLEKLFLALGFDALGSNKRQRMRELGAALRYLGFTKRNTTLDKRSVEVWYLKGVV